ncbi:hypothetical protein M2189_004849 [Bradyrhizobium japonicum]|uniref:hypothetical protein n=1 Tax=Bradyrhizobium japonicum TaxID=375 RepID=UPI002167D202|nr:hypothetical protein [Bradyrhizobium japonicum]MCS3496191.1 hypothetical protein [Bradyrhizobium japonicum]MCS3961646.1 hypothetical protein [Bradyrhizobium japonicum]MCS3993962.1 hypothetical protein [Bradyrhizobium japonicum]
MVRATSVFTPTDIPTFTYVERKGRNYESDLRRAFDIPKMIVSVSGPSKSGKTTLIRKVVTQDNLIHIYGANVKAPGDLWTNVLAWMGGPIETTETSGSKTGGTISVSGGGEIGIPLVAKGHGTAQGAANHESSSSVSKKIAVSLLDQIVKEVGSSDFVIFIDDFHYIERSVREEIGKQIKAAAELGVRICTASVPHRADDVVRSNTELRGRVTAIDMAYWSVEELEEIAYRGFRELNVDLAPELLRTLAGEAFGSPQLMQAIALNFCFEMNIGEQLENHVRLDETEGAIRKVLERTSTTTDFSTMLTALHAGPKQRGTERKRFRFADGTSGDVYRCVLLAIKEDPPALSLSYEQILSRATKICNGDSPVGSSLSESLKQMDGLAKLVQTAPVIEWDENVLDIVEPYFLFFLRCSPSIQQLAST